MKLSLWTWCIHTADGAVLMLKFLLCSCDLLHKPAIRKHVFVRFHRRLLCNIDSNNDFGSWKASSTRLTKLIPAEPRYLYSCWRMLKSVHICLLHCSPNVICCRDCQDWEENRVLGGQLVLQEIQEYLSVLIIFITCLFSCHLHESHLS